MSPTARAALQVQAFLSFEFVGEVDGMNLLGGSSHFLLDQWLDFKLFGITYLVGKIKFKLFFQGPLAK